MINFFSGKPASSTKPATTSNGVRASSASASSSSATVAQPPLKKTKLAPAPPITVVTTVKKKVAPPPTAHPRDPIAALSGYSKNALPEEKRRRIIDERLASQRQKSIETSLEAQLRAPVKSPSKLKAAGSSSKRSAASASKPKPKKPRKKVVDSDSEDDDFGGYGHSSRNASSGPSTPRGSKRASVDPHPISDSYQKVGREGVLPNYTVARNILAASFTSTDPSSAAALDSELSTPISSADIVTSNIKSYGPYFNGLGDAPRATLEYPGANASEEFLLLVPKDADEYDPLMELLATVRTIVTHYLTDDQREAFGTLDSLQVSNNAGMILPSAANGTHSTTMSSNAAAALVATDSINGTRAKSADLLDGQGSKAERRDELIGSQFARDAGSKTPEPHVNGISQTAPVSPTSHTGSIGASTGGSSVAKTVLINNALPHLSSDPPPNPSTPLLKSKAASSSSSNTRSESGASIKGFVGGTVSGLTKLLVGHPFDTIKVRMQCSPLGTYTGPLDCFLQLARRESLLGLYKGATPPAFGWALTDSVLLGSLHNYRRFFARFHNPNHGGEESVKTLPVRYHALAGLMAGWTNSFVTTPVELIKAKLQMQTQRVSLTSSSQVVKKEFSGPVDCIRQVVAQRGVLGLWHALPATLLFRSSFAAMFGSYEYFQRQLSSWKGTSWELSPGAITFISGGLGAEVFWLTAFPADVIKNRMMADNIKEPKYKDIRSAWLSAWNARGIEARW